MIPALLNFDDELHLSHHLYNLNTPGKQEQGLHRNHFCSFRLPLIHSNHLCYAALRS